MKNTKIKNIAKGAAALAFISLIYTCTEKVKSPCDEQADITFSVVGTYSEICDGATNTQPANSANIFIIHTVEETGEKDTLLASTLSTDGRLAYTIPNSRCGINHIKLVAVYNSYIYEDSLDFMCCDTTFYFNFERNCEETEETELSCESLDTTINLYLSNQYQGCIPVGTSQSEIKWNSVVISGDESITVDASSAVSLSGKFSVNITPTPDSNGSVQLGNQSLTMVFFVETIEIDTAATQLILPTTCTDSLGNTYSGSITINLEAEICDEGCSCPFSDTKLSQVNINKSGDGVLVGTSQDYTNQVVLEVLSGMLEDGCYMNITAITRYNSSALATSIPTSDEAIYDWAITSPTTFPIQIKTGSSLALSARFTPETSGTSADTFEISIDLYNSSGTLKESCSLLACFIGLGCENVCPEIEIVSLSAQEIDATTSTVIRQLKVGDVVSMDAGNIIEQGMNGILGNLCMSGLEDDGYVTYSISVPQNNDVVTCSNIILSMELSDDGQSGDKDYFEVNKNNLILQGYTSSSLTVTFNTPDIKTHIASGHSSTYRARLIINATDANGNSVCSQEIKLEAEVHESSIQISKSMNMKAFSQISDKESTPAYQVYKIDYYNDEYKYYGQIDNLSPELGMVDTLVSPPVPLTGHSFYFEVDNPTNTTLRQIPKLYLVNTTLNSYSQITSSPVANYSSNTDFANDLEDLVNTVFKKGNFQPRGNVSSPTFTFSSNTNEIMWAPSASASELDGPGQGISLTLGDVYIIWNPTGDMVEGLTIGSSNYSSYCDVAFLYIEGLSNGTGTTHNIGNVTFYVAYPLSIIKE